jgi:ABC-type multidrug transport system fused ATPase/permease subunit
LILDEATSALDSKTETEFMSTISAMKGSLTMIIIAHRLTTLKHCDRLIRLDQGKIVATGSYQDLVGTPVDPVVGKP